jgi:hypothetical protein
MLTAEIAAARVASVTRLVRAAINTSIDYMTRMRLKSSLRRRSPQFVIHRERNVIRGKARPA